MRNSPLISVLMPAYNAEKYISEAIESIVNQTYQDWELLICDDDSSDKTYEIAKSFKDERITVYKNPVNEKKPKTTNWLFTKSIGEIITIHDADDISLPNRFEMQLNLLVDKNCDFCGCDIEHMSKKGKRISVFIKKEKYRDKEFPRYGDATLMIKRKCLDRMQIFRPYFQNNMDYDLGLRLLENFEYKNLDVSLYLYRTIYNSTSKDYSSIKKVLFADLVRVFAAQRKKNGIDSLMSNDFLKIEKEEKKIIDYYLSNKGLMEANASVFLSKIKMHYESIRLSLVAIIKNPNKLNYYKILLANINKYVRKVLKKG